MRRRPLLCLLALLATALPAAAAEIGVKSLSGPPEEFPSHRLPPAEEVRVPSNLLLLDHDGRATSYHSFSTSPGVGFSVVQVTTDYPNFSPTTLTAPNGKRYVFNGSSITCNSGYCGSYTADLRMEAFTKRAPGGVAVFSISGGEVSGGSWSASLQGSTLLRAPQVDSMIAFDENTVSVGIDPDPCGFDDLCLLALEGSGQSPPYELVEGAAPVLAVSYTAKDAEGRDVEHGLRLAGLRVRITELRSERVLHDEAFGPARAAELPTNAEGHPLVRLPALPEGEFSVRLDLEGEVEGGGRIERTAFYSFPVLPQGYRLSGQARSEVLDDKRLEIRLGLEQLRGETSHLQVWAEVWSRDGRRPIAWIGGMSYPEVEADGQLALPVVLDGRWLALAEERGSELVLRNLRIQDPDTSIPLDQAAELLFRAPRLPRAAYLSASEVVRDDSLYFGAGDRTIPFHDFEPTTPGRGVNQTGILLVHGWCSGLAWPFFDFVNGRIGGTENFVDFNASRSHDNFARRIRDQGDALFTDSFSVVAHSQGGAAATHLRANYTSGLDNSTAPRPIQSMGTPYGGSTLMDYYMGTGLLGWLISEIFGLCGQQFSLTTLGSALWRIGIPNSVRDDVFFFRTRHAQPGNFWQRLQFWRWRCNAASFVIGGADDGVVSTGQGNLSGGRNMGITDRECHTGGMNHPDQRDNAARNDTMDRLGRPQPQILTARCQVDSIFHSGGPTGQGYLEQWVDASSSTPGNFPISTFTFINGGVSTVPSTNPRYGPLFPGLPGQAPSYLVTVIVTDTSGASASTSCFVTGLFGAPPGDDRATAD